MIGSSSRSPLTSILYLPGLSISIVSGASCPSVSDFNFSIIALLCSSSVIRAISSLLPKDFFLFLTPSGRCCSSALRTSFGLMLIQFPDLSITSLLCSPIKSIITEFISCPTSSVIEFLSFSFNGSFVKKKRLPPQSGHPFKSCEDPSSNTSPHFRH